MQEIRSSNPPVVIGICDPNKSQPRQHRNFHLPFWIWKCGKGGKKLQKLENLENKKSFLEEIKHIFQGFWRTAIWWKN